VKILTLAYPAVLLIFAVLLHVPAHAQDQGSDVPPPPMEGAPPPPESGPAVDPNAAAAGDSKSGPYDANKVDRVYSPPKPDTSHSAGGSMGHHTKKAKAVKKTASKKASKKSKKSAKKKSAKKKSKKKTPVE